MTTPKAPKVQNTSTKDDQVINDLPIACADEKAAVEFMEAQRWGGKPFCPTCGEFNIYQMKDSKTGERQANYRWRCHGCKDQFTVRKGTVLEDSRIPLRHWCFAFWRATTSKKGVSALEIKRQTGLSYKSALFLLNRIRFAMDEAPVTPMSGAVEVDEVYIGGKPRVSPSGKVRGQKDKFPVVAVLERETGRVKAAPVASVNADNLRAMMKANIDFANATLMTDEAIIYRPIGREFRRGHKTVNHGKQQYVKGDATTNRVEGFFSLLRRSIHGIYHNVSREHLPKYVAEAGFRYSHRLLRDGERVQQVIRSSIGKHLTYEASKA